MAFGAQTRKDSRYEPYCDGNPEPHPPQDIELEPWKRTCSREQCSCTHTSDGAPSSDSCESESHRREGQCPACRLMPGTARMPPFLRTSFHCRHLRIPRFLWVSLQLWGGHLDGDRRRVMPVCWEEPGIHITFGLRLLSLATHWFFFLQGDYSGFWSKPKTQATSALKCSYAGTIQVTRFWHTVQMGISPG